MLPDIDPRLLERCYRREAPHRPHWPSSFALALADPLVSRILAMMIRHAVPTYGRRRTDAPYEVRAAAIRSTAHPRIPPEHVIRIWPGIKLRQLAPGEIDRKRAASGDCE